MPLAAFEQDVISFGIGTVVDINDDRVLHILIPEPFIPDEVIGPRVKCVDREDLTGRNTHIVLKTADCPAAAGSRDGGNQIGD